MSTCGENENEVSQELVKFLKFVKADLTRSEDDFEDDYVKNLQLTIRQIKENREMEERFMTLEELLREEYSSGKMEGKEELRTETICKMLSKKKYSYEEIAELNDVPVEKVKEIEKLML